MPGDKTKSAERGMTRIPPADALHDLLERVVRRQAVHVESADVLITRERLPRLNPYATVIEPWRYAVTTYPDPRGLMFSSFQHAASEAETIAAAQHSRVLYIEDNAPTLVADYRRAR